MKKLFLLPACLVGIVIAAEAQKNNPVPPPPPPKPPKVEMVKFTPPVIVPDDPFLERNTSIASYNFRISETQPVEQIVLTLKNKKKETYNLKDEKEKKAFTDKYGEPPVAPPPPPLPPVPRVKKQS